MRRRFVPTGDGLEPRELKTGTEIDVQYYATALDAPDEVGGKYFYLDENDYSKGGYYLAANQQDVMPGGSTTVINNLGDWQVGGTPALSNSTLLPGPVDTTTWVVVGPSYVSQDFLQKDENGHAYPPDSGFYFFLIM